jgi:branched-chain amino acid transport system permease protein
VKFLGQVAGKRSRDIALMGMSRTFQHVRLLPQMSVLDNVAIGAHRREYRGLLASCWPARGDSIGATRPACWQRPRARSSASGSPTTCSTSRILPLGKQRIMEIARALASDPCLLLLDEPAAGLRYLEKRALADLLKRLKGEGLSVLLVEHDMDFVMGLVDRVYVMDFGQKIAEGLPEQVQRDPACSRPTSAAWTRGMRQ